MMTPRYHRCRRALATGHRVHFGDRCDGTGTAHCTHTHFIAAELYPGSTSRRRSPPLFGTPLIITPVIATHYTRVGAPFCAAAAAADAGSSAALAPAAGDGWVKSDSVAVPDCACALRALGQKRPRHCWAAPAGAALRLGCPGNLIQRGSF